MSICRPSCHIKCDGSNDKQFVSKKQIALNAVQRGVARKQHDDEQSEDDLHRVERMYPSSPQLADLARVTTRMTLPTTLIARVRTTVTLRYFFAQKPITLITLAAVVSRNTSGDNATDSIPAFFHSTDNGFLCLLRKRFFYVYAFRETFLR